MKVFLFSLALSAIVATAGTLFAFGGDIEAIKAWKIAHIDGDTRMFKVIRGDLQNLKDGQSKMLHYLLRREKK